MNIVLWFLFAYILGGVTFIPGVIYLLFYVSKTVEEPVDGENENGNNENNDSDITESTSLLDTDAKDRNTSQQDSDPSNDQEKATLLAHEKLRSFQEEDIGVDAYATCWVTVARDYFVYPTGDTKNTANPPPQSVTDVSIAQNEGAYSNLYKLMSNSSSHNRHASKESIDISPPPSSSLSRSATASSNITTTSNSPSSVGKKSLSKLNKYFAVLKHGNILLYLDSDQAKLKHVIVLANHVVSIWPRNVPDGELFLKRSAICLARKDSREGFEALVEATMLYDDPSAAPPPTNAFYLYTDNCTEKEDFYFALIRASKQSSSFLTREYNPLIMAVPYKYKNRAMMDLIVRLHSNDANIQSRWLNAILGRLFLSIQGTGKLEEILEQKAQKKLARVKRPGYLGEFEIRKLHVGDSIPMFTNLKLKDLTPEGQLVIEADVEYSGGLSVEIATKAILNLGSKFKARDVSLVLAVTLKSLEGRMQFHVKPPPSNRIWYAFESMPKMNLVIEPIVSSKQITYSMVTKTIENRIKDAFKETLVVPNFDDICFSSTLNDFYRGGIWDRDVQAMDLPSSPDGSSPGGWQQQQDKMTGSNGTNVDNSVTDDAESIANQSFVSSDSKPSSESKSLSNKSSSLLKKTKTTILSMSTSSSLDVSSRKNGTLRRRNSSGSVKTVSTFDDNDPDSVTQASSPTSPDFDVAAHIGELKQAPSSPEPKSPSSPQKKDIVGTVKKWGSWYFKDKIGGKAEAGSSERPQVKSTQSNEIDVNEDSFDADKNKEKEKSPLAAPLPHNFPPEIMQLLSEEGNQEDHQHGVKFTNEGPYGRIPEMQVPSAIKRTNTVARKPVHPGGYQGHSKMGSKSSGPDSSLISSSTGLGPGAGVEVEVETHSSHNPSHSDIMDSPYHSNGSNHSSKQDDFRKKDPNEDVASTTTSSADHDSGSATTLEHKHYEDDSIYSPSEPVTIPLRQTTGSEDAKTAVGTGLSSFDATSTISTTSTTESITEGTSSSVDSTRSTRRMSNVSLPSGIKDQGIFVFPTAAEPVVSSSAATNTLKSSPRHSKKHRVPRKMVSTSSSSPNGPYMASGIVQISQESLPETGAVTISELEHVDPVNNLLSHETSD